MGGGRLASGTDAVSGAPPVPSIAGRTPAVPRSGTRTKIVIGVVAALVVVAVAVPATWYLRDRQARDRFHEAVTSFAAAWRSGHLDSIRYEGATGADVARQVAATTAALTPAATEVPAAVDVTATSGPTDGAGTAALHVRWDLGQGRTWQYDTSVRLRDGGAGWQVQWSPAVVHPRLAAGQVLTTSRTPAARGRILGAGGQVLVSQRPVVVIGIQPNRAKDPRGAATAVAAVVGVDAAALTQRVLAAAPGAFVDAITLREADYQGVRDRLQPIPGAVFQRTTRSLAPTSGFARALLGTTGPATKEIVDAAGGRVRTGDVTGLSGLQRRYDAQLSGTPGITVQAVTAGAPATAPVALLTVPPVPGTDLTLTLDRTVQLAAEAALAGAKKPSALVAIRVGTGEVLAVANGPAAAAGYDRALIGRYPPGSTFKVASGFALLRSGITTATPVPCPASITVGGRVFHNAEKEVLSATTPFHQDFAQSCNTAFIGASQHVSAADLHDAAVSLGYARPDRLGVDAFTGQVPATAGAVEHAADAIGQGTVLASPLTVASVSASVAAGAYHAPRLVLTAAGTPGTPAASPSASPRPSLSDATSGPPSASPPGGATPGAAATGTTDTTGEALPAEPVAALRALMGEVVTSGTGTALRSVPGEPVHGKTGTAEFGSANPPLTHAWFTGYQGDVAFAVVVEGGGFGGVVAAPIAADFLRRLA